MFLDENKNFFVVKILDEKGNFEKTQQSIFDYDSTILRVLVFSFSE